MSAVSPLEPLAIENCVSTVVGTPSAPVRQPVRPLHGEAAVEVDPDHTRQALLGGDAVDQVAQPVAVVTSESHASHADTRRGGSP